MLRARLNRSLQYKLVMCQNDKIINLSMSRTPKSHSLPRSESTNRFFQDNAMKQFQLTKMSSYSTHNINNFSSNNISNNYNSSRSFSQTQAPLPTNSHQLNQEMSSTGLMKNSRLNPKQFLHREVFNTKLYQNEEGGGKGIKKYFKIELAKGGQQPHPEQQLGQYFKQFSRALSLTNFHQNEELKKLWKSFSHHLQLLEKHAFLIPSSQPIKLSLKNTLASLQCFMLAISAQIQPLQSYKKEHEQNLSNLQRKVQIVTEHELQKLEQLSTNKLENQLNEHHTINRYKSRINFMDFQIKKYILRVEKLQTQLNEMKKEVNSLRESNLVMKKERENIEKWKEDYEYKIKKLKEELEVAHIVKQQNLEDKFNYILGWKL